MADTNASKAERRRIRHGEATISWGPKAYGKPQMVANCPVDNVDDLIAAVLAAASEIKAARE